MSLNYTKKTINNFLHPQNIGEIKKADAKATVGNMVCGDQLSFSIKVKDGKIQDLKFLSFGCASNIATASILTQKVRGLTLAQAKKFDWNKIVRELGGLPQQKVHCSILAVEGLKKVISEYEKKTKAPKTKIKTKTKTKTKKSKINK
jgi:nitrogen fixation protein NifU and related proteins